MRNAVQEIMDEIIDYGGVATPRGTAWLHARDCALSKGADERSAAKCADWAALSGKCKALTPEEAAGLIQYRPGIFD